MSDRGMSVSRFRKTCDRWPKPALSGRTAFRKFLAGAQQTAGTIEERGATVAAGAKDIAPRRFSMPKRRAGSLDYAQSHRRPRI